MLNIMVIKAVDLVAPVDKSDLPSTYDEVPINLHSSLLFEEFKARLAVGNCIITMMSELSFSLPEHMQIGALLNRIKPNLSIYIKDRAIDMTADYRLMKGATLSTAHLIIAAQVMDLRNDIIFIKDDDVDAIIRWDKDQESEIAGYKKFILHTNDLIPPVGTGIVAVVVSDDNKDLRKTVQSDHDKILGSCSNVERTLAKICRSNEIEHFAAYCETDTNGYYHASACALIDGNFKKASISQSTYADVANQLYHQLIN